MQQMISVCKNPWCKAHFPYTENDMVVVTENSTNMKINQIIEEVQKMPPQVCPKCRSFDTELSGGVTWTEKKYEGKRFDGLPHPISVNVSKYTDRKRW